MNSNDDIYDSIKTFFREGALVVEKLQPNVATLDYGVAERPVSASKVLLATVAVTLIALTAPAYFLEWKTLARLLWDSDLPTADRPYAWFLFFVFFGIGSAAAFPVSKLLFRRLRRRVQ
jgi:hypothetical protein